MNYALYQYTHRDGVVAHALVNIKTGEVMLADLVIYGERGSLVWKPAAHPEYVWVAIKDDKHHKIVAMATHPHFIKARG